MSAAVPGRRAVGRVRAAAALAAAFLVETRVIAVLLLGGWLAYAGWIELNRPADDSRAFWAAAALCALCSPLGLLSRRR